MTGLIHLSARLASRWPEGNAAPPRTPEVLLDAVLSGQPLRLLEWMHLLRYKPSLDARFPARALPSAARIWQASVEEASLRRLLLDQMAAGLCGQEGLCDSMVESFHQLRPLARLEPHLQDVFEALLVLHTDPSALLALLISQDRTPSALMARVGLPEGLPVMGPLIGALVGTLRSQPDAQRWLLECLSELTMEQQDEIASAMILGMTAAERAGLEELSWWLRCGYGRTEKGTRWRRLSPEARAEMDRVV